MAKEGDGAVSEASGWENEEREELLALLTEEGEIPGAEITGTCLFIALYFFLVFYLPLFCHTPVSALVHGSDMVEYTYGEQNNNSLACQVDICSC